MSGPRLIDEILLFLHKCGWTIGDTAVGEGPDRIWLVFGGNGESIIRVDDPSRAVAWAKAFLQAKATGMAGISSWGETC
jgi:hypothetical protein